MVRASRRRPATFALMAALLIPILPSALVAPVAAVSPNLVISQVYGAGGNSGALLNADYVELYNRGTEPVALDGYSVQYTSATGTGNFGASTTQLTELPDATLAPGQYFLIQEAAGANGDPLPTPNLTDTTPIAMAAGAGKVAIVTGDAGLGCNGSSTPCSAEQLARIVDLVGYGNATFFEGTGAAPTLSTTLAAFRDDGGATDTDDNAADFTAAAPNPRSSAPDEDDAPTVESTTPADGATNVPVTTSTITVTFSEEVVLDADAIVLDCSPADTPVNVVDTSNPGTTFTMELIADLPEGATCSVTVDAGKVSDTDDDDPPDTMDEDDVFEFSTESADACAGAFTAIYDIQGSGASAAITGTVTTQGVVVGDFQGTTGLSGFYLQDATGDGDPATSDGIFVYTGNENSVSAGDLVRVTGVARERFNQTALNGSNSNNAAVPAANIVLCDSASVEPTDVELPFASSTAPERYEGMLVRLPQDLVISEYFNYERFGELVLALPLDGETRPFTPTLLEEPGGDAGARALANALSRITLDDGLSVQNPNIVRHPNGEPFSLDNRFRGGDLVTNTVGVLGWDFDLYRIQPTAPAEYTSVNPRPEAPADVGGRLTVAAMNTLNFFITGDPLDDGTGNNDNPADNICGPQPPNHDCRGWDLSQPAEFDRQRDKLIAALAGLDADVIGLNELENTTGVDPLGDPELGVAAGLNEVFGDGTYASIDTGVIGTDAIRVGLIYRPAAVTPVGGFAVLDSTVDPRFDTAFNRPALAQTFEENATGARFTVVVNHLKSKGSDCNTVGDPDTGDGQGNCNLTRQAAAQALVDWIATDPTGSGDRDYLVMGDLNSYAMEDPIDAILAGADGEAGTIDDYTNLVATYGGPYAYSYVFDGQAGYLDHALSSATLTSQVTGVTEWHINADEPDVLDYDTSFKPAGQEAIYEPNAYRASDHDPVIVGLDLEAFGFDGYLAPLANPPTVNSVRAGSTAPIKFSLAGTSATDVLFTTPTITRISCTTGADLGDPVPATGLGSVVVDPVAGEYKVEWKTPKSLAGTCQRFELTLDDGTFRTLLFHLR